MALGDWQLPLDTRAMITRSNRSTIIIPFHRREGRQTEAPRAAWGRAGVPTGKKSDSQNVDASGRPGKVRATSGGGNLTKW